MISYAPEDTFHTEEKKKKRFMRKSKGKIKPYIANLLTLQISPDLFMWQDACVNIFRKKPSKNTKTCTQASPLTGTPRRASSFMSI